MDEDSKIASPTAPQEPIERMPTPPPVVARRASGVGAWLVAFVALGIAAFSLWRVHAIEIGQSDAQTAMRNELTARIDDTARALDQRKHEFDSLRARVADADSVDKSVREELLSLGERSRHLEDAVANLAEQRLTGRDAIALNEAEFLLLQAQERVALFHDAQSALTAYHLADSALAAAEDPAFASVRQAIAAEIRSIEASQPADTQAALATLERVRHSLTTLPAPSTASAEDAPVSRWQRFLTQFVRISHGSDTRAFAASDIGLVRSLNAIDLRAAEAALLARDADGYTAALKSARAGIGAGFDLQSAAVKADLADLDRLASTPLTTSLPELGGALRELRNLRATRVLAQPAMRKPAALPAAPAAEPPAPTQHEGADR